MARIPLHPFFLAVFPVVALYSRNVGEVDFSEPVFLIILMLTLSATACLLTYSFFRDAHKAALATSIGWLFFYTFIHIQVWTEDTTIAGVVIGRIQYLILANLLSFAAICWFIWRSQGVRHLTRILNVMAIAFIAVGVVANASAFLLQPSVEIRSVPDAFASNVEPTTQSAGKKPDIYYIILDGYARSDSLKKTFGYDNSELLEYLRQKGFVIADKSTSNYKSTHFSVPSTLHLDYIQNIVGAFNPVGVSKLPFRDLARKNLVVALLRKWGYRIVNVASGWSGSHWKDADVRIVPSRWNLSEFQTEFAKLTPLLILWQMRDRQLSPYTHHRERILFALENLPEAARLPSPKFVYSHIMAPHRPFVFDAQGRDVSRHDVGFTLAGPEDAPKATWKDPRWLTGGKEQTREEFVESYRQQITFLSNRIREVIERVLEASASPPVIVVQGDHGYLPPHDYSGPNPIERFRIINAYLLPDGGSDHIYPEITPVNTFRVIFNHYFGQKFELLPDRNYGDPTEEDHKSFVDVTEQVQDTTLGR